MHGENRNEKQLQQASETITDDPNKTTIVLNYGNENHNIMKTLLIDTENTGPLVRRSSRMRSTDSVVKLGNPVTH